MIKIENVVTPSDKQWEAVIRGVRNPFNSWEKADSEWVLEHNTLYRKTLKIGEKDLTLMNRLANAGDDHGKFMRMLPVIVDITAPFYWWKQLDTYKIGTVSDSCSTMHTLTSRPFKEEDFSFDYGGEAVAKIFVDAFNEMWKLWYRAEGEEKQKLWYTINEMLPNCYNQKRTWSANYQTLKHIYHARKNHKLGEWHDFCDWIETLPYAKELIIGEME